MFLSWGNRKSRDYVYGSKSIWKENDSQNLGNVQNMAKARNQAKHSSASYQVFTPTDN